MNVNPSYSLYPSLQVPYHGFYPPPPAGLTAPASNPVVFNINCPQAPQPYSLPQAAAYPPQSAAYGLLPSYAPESSCPPQQPAPLYPSPRSYNPTPVFSSPLASQTSSVPAPAAPAAPAAWYPLADGSTATLPASKNHSQSDSVDSQSSLFSLTVSKPTKDSGAIKQSFVVRSYLSPSQKSDSQPSKSNTELQDTVKAETPFNPRADAVVLRKAVKGFVADKKAIINVLTSKNNQQRLDIASCYRTMYNKDLIFDLKNEFTITGDFQSLIIAMLIPVSEFLAYEVHRAIVGVNVDCKTLVEILCTASNVEIDAIKTVYAKLYSLSLEKDLRPIGIFGLLLTFLVKTRRSEDKIIDEVAVIQDVHLLMSPGGLRMDTNEPSFVSILCKRSYAHLQRVFKEYERISGRPLKYAISCEFSGDMKDGLLALIRAIEDKVGFFTERIYDAFTSRITKNEQLIRIIVTRYEIDLRTIKRTYQKRYGKKLELEISQYTSANFKKGLLALVGGYY